jgi:DNA-binding IclR family transcriptional regulator
LSKKASAYTISVVDETLNVILALGNKEDKSIRELGTELSIPKSTLYRILRTLEAKDFVRQNKRSEKYSLGVKFFELGMMLKNTFDIKDTAYPHILDLRNRTKETIQLAIVDKETILLIDTIEGTHDLRVFSRAGRRLPLTYGNFGKVFLSDYADEEIFAMLRKYPLKRYGANSVMDNEIFIEHVKEVRKKHISVGIDDPIDGAFAMAAPIFDKEHKTVASISMAGAKTQASIANLDHLKQELLATVRLISRELGFSE